ncbi:MAG: hypothetical protein AAF957_00920, partial [Planctomycetota bacterium]
AAAGAVSALIFGGDVGEAAARGAVWSGTAGAVGAVGGAIAGTAADQMEAQQAQIEAQKELAALRARIGDDAFEGLGALAECKHEVALAYARTAARSANPAYAGAGAWLEALTYVDAGEPEKADAVYPVIVERDAETDTVEDAAARTRDALETIRDFREKEGLSRTCG